MIAGEVRASKTRQPDPADVSDDIRQIPRRFELTFARFRRFRSEDRAFGRLDQRQFTVAASKW